MTKISVHQVTKRFGGKTVLEQISFEARVGTVTALLGNSGAGKTTLFRLICGLEVPDSGKIFLNGKNIGFVFQQFHLWKHMTVLENCILAPVHVLKMSKQDAIQKANGFLLSMGMEHKIKAYPETLSGGEQQRVAIVRALMMDPEVVLFDEPTSSLDPNRTEIVLEMIQSLTKKGIIILVITHDIDFARRVSDSILFFDKGNLVETAKCEKGVIFKKTQRLSEFLNCTNSLESALC